jgi:hypothetical protein
MRKQDRIYFLILAVGAAFLLGFYAHRSISSTGDWGDSFMLLSGCVLLAASLVKLIRDFGDVLTYIQ